MSSDILFKTIHCLIKKDVPTKEDHDFNHVKDHDSCLVIFMSVLKVVRVEGC